MNTHDLHTITSGITKIAEQQTELIAAVKEATASTQELNYYLRALATELKKANNFTKG